MFLHYNLYVYKLSFLEFVVCVIQRSRKRRLNKAPELNLDEGGDEVCCSFSPMSYVYEVQKKYPDLFY